MMISKTFSFNKIMHGHGLCSNPKETSDLYLYWGSVLIDLSYFYHKQLIKTACMLTYASKKNTTSILLRGINQKTTVKHDDYFDNLLDTDKNGNDGIDVDTDT